MIPFEDARIQAYEQMGCWSQETLYDYFCNNVQAYGDALAVVDPENRAQFTSGEPQRLSYLALSKKVHAIATALHKSGVVSGDVILVQMPNIWELVATYFAIARLGAVVSPVAVQFRSRELHGVIAQTNPKAFISSLEIKGFNHVEYFLKSFPDFEGPVFVVDALETGSKLVTNICTVKDDGSYDLPGCTADANAIYSICWTSGTEGAPKGVPRTHNNWRCSGIAVKEGYGIDGPETFLMPFPLINTAAIGGVLTPWLMSGGALILHHPFDMEVFLRQLETEKVTITLAAPALLNSIIETPGLRARLKNCALKRVGTGSAPPSPKMLREFEAQLDIKVINMFGSNEGVLLCSDDNFMPDPEQRAKYFPRVGTDAFTSCNISHTWLSSKLVDPATGNTIETAGIMGELAVKGPSIFPGYYSLGQLDRKNFDEDGFFYTGDLFEIAADDEGELRLYKAAGRQKEIIIRGGFNISPVELDNLLAEVPGVVEVAVAGYPDPRLGEKICVYVVLEPGVELTLGSIGEFLEARGLARYKWPEKMMVLDQLPRNALNKVLRRSLSGMVPKNTGGDQG